MKIVNFHKQHLIALFVLLSFLYGLFSCRSTNNFAGRYRSNFAVHGFFVTRIYLNPDSTFGYRMSGDLVFDTSAGYYKVKKNYLLLYHQPLKPDTTGYAKYGKEAVILSQALTTTYDHINEISRYKIGYNKLFVCDSSGKVVKKQFGYSKRKKYLFFGKRWDVRRYYLKRLD